jgi:hypothetical protein
MTLTHSSIPNVRLPFLVDPEEELVSYLVQFVSHAGICSDPVSIINFYVALKSKPLAILAGPEQTGKIAMVQCLARVLMGADCLQCQMMAGHPWSAAKSGNVAFFTGIHTRYNSEKLLCLIEEAWQPEHSDKVFIACLTRISPAELEEFFIAIAFQLQHRQIVRFGDVHFTEPVPFPPNLFLIGTMDTSRFDWWDSDLLANTTVIQWPEKSRDRFLCFIPDGRIPAAEKFFLRSSVRNEQAAYQKLCNLNFWKLQPALPLFLIESIFEKEGITLPRALINEVMTYLANSWSGQGAGLFHPSLQENLTIALDLGIIQTYLPQARKWIGRSKVLQENLGELLNGNYPRAAQALAALTG